VGAALFEKRNRAPNGADRARAGVGEHRNVTTGAATVPTMTMAANVIVTGDNNGHLSNTLPQ
jgi:hypothetical protein